MAEPAATTKRPYVKLTFTREEEERIIDFVKQNAELYDPKNPKYKDTGHKAKLWNDLAETFENSRSGQIFFQKSSVL